MKDEARAEGVKILKLNPKLPLGYPAKTFVYKNKADLEKIIIDLRGRRG
jgi:hypothetical protein